MPRPRLPRTSVLGAATENTDELLFTRIKEGFHMGMSDVDPTSDHKGKERERLAVAVCTRCASPVFIRDPTVESRAKRAPSCLRPVDRSANSVRSVYPGGGKRRKGTLGLMFNPSAPCYRPFFPNENVMCGVSGYTRYRHEFSGIARAPGNSPQARCFKCVYYIGVVATSPAPFVRPSSPRK